MVAGAQVKRGTESGTRLDTRSIPAIDSEAIEESIEEFEVFLMGMDRAHLGLQIFELCGNETMLCELNEVIFI